MSKVRVAGFGISLDGFSAGIEQSLDDPLGKRGPELFQWFFHTRTFCAMHGKEGGSIHVDDAVARRSDPPQTLAPRPRAEKCRSASVAHGGPPEKRNGRVPIRQIMRSPSF